MMSRASVSAVSHVAAWVNLKAGAATFFVAKHHSYYYICDAKGQTLKTMSVSNVGEIVGVAGSTITSRKGDWIFTWGKDGKKISARSVNN